MRTCAPPRAGIHLAWDHGAVKEFLARVGVTAIAVWLAHLMVSGITVTAADTWWQQILVYLGVGLVLALVQMIIKPFVKALTFILYILTLGLFSLVVNALLLMLVGWLTSAFEWGLQVESFWPSAVLGALVISIVTGVLSIFLPRGRD